MLHAAVLVALTLNFAAPPDAEKSADMGAKDVSHEKVEQEPKTPKGPPDYGPPEFDVGAEMATHEEVEPLSVESESLTTLQLDSAGNLLACDGGANQIKVISPDGLLKSTISLEFGPEALDIAPDGTIYCGGHGQLARLKKTGEILCTGDSPGEPETETDSKRKRRNISVRISGIAVLGDHVFVAFGSGGGTGSKSKLYRYDRDLKGPVLLAEGLRACCQRCDLTALDETLYLAENGAHRVVMIDPEGEVLRKWGERSRTELEGFGSCCNPMNLSFGTDGVLYTSESGLGRVKRYSADGEYLGLVGYVGTNRYTRASGMASSCSNIAIDVTPDGKTIYVMDFRNKLIRVLKQKE